MRLLVLSALLSCFFVAPPAMADVDDNMRRLMDTAARIEEGRNLASTVIVLIETYPGDMEDILAYARSVAPDPSVLDGLMDGRAVSVPVEAVEEESLDTPVAEPAVEEMAAADDAIFTGWDGEAQLGLSLSSGDTSEQAVSGALTLNKVFSQHWDHSIHFEVDYARRQKVTSQERYLGDYQLYYRGWDRFYLFGFVRGESDRFSGFDYRFSETIGTGYTVIDTDATNWSVEAGPGLRQTKLDLGGTQHEVLAFLASNFSHSFNDKVTVSDETRFFLGSERISIENLAAIESAISEALALRLSFAVRYDSKVPAGSSKTDTLTRASVVYAF